MRRKRKTGLKKLIKVLRRKWKKPALYTLLASVFIYWVIGHTVFPHKVVQDMKPHFLISRLSYQFEETEFMHLLLTIQEIKKSPKLKQELIDFVNAPFSTPCPQDLKQALNEMNWMPHALHTRVHKMFEMCDIYDHLMRLTETIDFLSEEIKTNKQYLGMEPQIEMLIQEKENIIANDLTKKELNFLNNYAGLIQTIRKLD